MSSSNIHTLLVALFLVFLTSLTATSSYAEKTTIAVASNFSHAMKTIVANFKAVSEHEITLVFGSSGKLFAQIHNGAPFDAFFSADAQKPKALIESNKALKNSHFTYAIGALVLWSEDDQTDTLSLLKNGTFKKLAIANSRLAPYGLAAAEVLDNLSLSETVKQKLVRGENISQTFQFVKSGNAQLGFIAKSQLSSESKYLKSKYLEPKHHENTANIWHVPAELHKPIRQDAVLLSRGARNIATLAFLEFMKSNKAKEIIRRAGYNLQK